MEQTKKYNLFFSIKQEWINAFFKKEFFTLLILTLSYVVALLIFMGYYFRYLEARQGIVLNDWILNILPAKDFSFIFGLLYSAFIFGVLYLFTKPLILLRVFETVVIVYSIRAITLCLIKLETPEGFIPLLDPVANHLKYGGKLVTKDLFFSGHTASI